VNAKNYQDARSKLKEVEALPNRTPYDTHVMNELFGVAYVRLNNYVEAGKYLEPGVTDGFLEPKDVYTRIKALAQLNYQIKNYDKAIDYGNRAIEAEPTNTEMHIMVAQAYYLQGD
jgi:tetratricopeptide (TPR) repeat protein